MDTLCRVCMLSSKDMINIFDGNPESETSIADIISHYIGLEVTRGDLFSETICALCLQDARDYRILGSSEQSQQIRPQVKQENGVYKEDFLQEEVNQILHCQVKEESIEKDLLVEVVYGIPDCKRDISFSAQGVRYQVKEEQTEQEGAQQFYGQNCHKKSKNIEVCDTNDIDVDYQGPFKCLLCEQSFPHEWSLQVHARIHVGRWPFKCTQCPKSCRTAGDLRLHNRIHTGERPYQCDYCEKSFRERQGLKVHIRVHTGERPYKCSYCEKTYKERKSLRVHIRNHTGDRPYKCSYCHSSFADPSSHRSHIKIHTRKTI
ncbi:zinc finger protein 32 [Drosophila rhopaloa]|uniref:Zinc finger protein 32 n=1 Tax=Drosophila rhopaloa TaxID=1041015 RepID=A0A6P4EGK4_DRORH|nr:zinc finger protein 32 [Drosophila rhopaloa]